MNIIRMTGGLGNQMFQYALYLKLKEMGREVKFDDVTEYAGRENARPIMLWCFGIDYERATGKELNTITDGFMRPVDRIRRKLFGRKSLEYQENGCNFDPVVLQKEPAYLTGYFQSEKYFADMKDKVRNAFTFTDRVYKILTQDGFGPVLDQIESCESISVHFRRGDYVSGSAIYGGNCTDAYYRKAIEEIRKIHLDATFFLFSNDAPYVKEWVQRFYPGDPAFFVIEGSGEEKGYLDLLLMSRCRHQIVANSSFSWWGAYLDAFPEKMVFAPARWFNNQDCQDIYTENMIRIDAEGNLEDE